MSIVLGCIADDLTGATDLAMILVREGMKTVQVVGVPEPGSPLPDADAVVIALKSRTIPADEAIEMSLAACDWLQAAGAQQIFFKYCSTFDSTKDGNIGPVTDALMEKLDCPQTIACPSFPENGRSVYKGHLFVNDVLLSESSLRNHPLTPMHDSNLNRVLSEQSKSTIRNIYYDEIDQGSQTILTSFQRQMENSPTIFIMDAINDEHLLFIGSACHGMKLVTGGSAIAQGLPDNFRFDGLLPKKSPIQDFSAPSGSSVILSGSCSETTLAQLDHAKSHVPHFRINATEILQNKPVLENALTWAEDVLQSGGPILFYSSDTPDAISKIQHGEKPVELGSKIETVMGDIASHLKDMGVRRFVVAGGETSGAVISALNVKTMEIGPAIDPGVPWTKSLEGDTLALALKSGNFGSNDFFTKALNQLDALSTTLQEA